MNCFDCSINGSNTPALGCCTSCGAGVCADHVELDVHESAHTSGPGIYTPHVTRVFTCAVCAQVLHDTRAQARRPAARRERV